ncbi:helix-turn-helix domain-containing protein [Nocardia sp. NPDC004068]|uniref:helix-turn-helix domain-containing protein n=1 Tax=Nocardia sp. NPDC004068 TaxID=3364303 RepID=UPI0036C5C272
MPTHGRRSWRSRRSRTRCGEYSRTIKSGSPADRTKRKGNSMGAIGSTLARRALGRQLQELRKRAEVSQFQASRVLGISPQTMGRLEDGVSVRSASDLYMNALCDHYGVTDEKRRAVLALAREVRSTARHGGGWWRADMDCGTDDFDPRTVLEDSAR